jgi:hypothetical protein
VGISHKSAELLAKYRGFVHVLRPFGHPRRGAMSPGFPTRRHQFPDHTIPNRTESHPTAPAIIRHRRDHIIVMAGLVPAIHVDQRVKPAGDAIFYCASTL